MKAGLVAVLGLFGLLGAEAVQVTPVVKVITMLQNLEKKVAEDGQLEAAQYDKFACFCKTTVDQKQYDIEQGELQKSELETSINVKTAERSQLDTAVSGLNQQIAALEKELEGMRQTSSARRTKYEKEHSDLDRAVKALAQAIQKMKDSAKPEQALLMIKSNAALFTRNLFFAPNLDTDLTDRVLRLISDTPSSSAAPQAAGMDYKAPQKHSYEYQSSDILTTLQSLHDTFLKTKREIETTETASSHQATMAEAAKLNEQSAAKDAAAEKNQASARLSADVSALSADLVVVSKNLNDNQAYVQTLAANCETRAQEWDARSKLRAEELGSIMTALTVLNAKGQKLDAVNYRPADAPPREYISVRESKTLSNMSDDALIELIDAGATSFIQVNINPRQQFVVTLLKERAQLLSSPSLAALATKISESPAAFAKVRELISNLVASLEQQQIDDADHNSWCESELKRVTGTRDEKKANVERLTSDIQSLRATIDEASATMAQLGREVSELNAALSKQTELRAEENAHNTKAITDSKEGSDAVNDALTVLSTFYKKAQTSVAAIQFKSLYTQEPTDMPEIPTPFVEAYAGRQGDSVGILGLLETIKSDFDRTLADTQTSEAAAAAAFTSFKADTEKLLADKTDAISTTTAKRDAAKTSMAEKQEDLRSNEDMLVKAEAELTGLQPTCVTTGGTYEDRAARRQEEVDSLKEALAIFEGTSFNGKDKAFVAKKSLRTAKLHVF